jgi:hypothetical protein
MGFLYPVLAIILIISSLSFASNSNKVDVYELLRDQDLEKKPKIETYKKNNSYNRSSSPYFKKRKRSKKVEPEYTTVPMVKSKDVYKLVPIRTQLSATLIEDVSNIDYSKEVAAVVNDDYEDIELRDATIIGNFRVYKRKKERVYIKFHTLLLDNGKKEIKINAHAVSSFDQHDGLLAVVDKKQTENVLKIIGETAAAVVAASTYTQTAGLSGRIVDKTLVKEIDKLEIEALVSVSKGTNFNLFLDRALKIEI